MSQVVISVENLSKSYRLGVISTGTFYGDVNRWWARLRGHPDPYIKIGESDHGNRDDEMLHALKNVNFQIRDGEAVGIIGRNGAGKSTLLKILSRVTGPTSGLVKVKGRIASLLEVGTGFHPELTGRENIFLNGAIMGMRRAEVLQKFDEIVDFSGVERFIDTPVKRYSSGMYVRLAFAVSAHLDPEILIVDEVLAVGDAEFQRKCLGKMGDVASQGRTVLFVSHNMSAIQRMCSSCIWMDKGEVQDIGETENVLEKYLAHLKDWDRQDVAAAKRAPGFGGTARFMDAYTINPSGEKTDVFKFGAPVSVYLEVKSPVDMDGLSFVIGIDGSMDYRIATVLSEDENARFSISSTSALGVTVKLSGLRLKPGIYYLTLGLRRGRLPLDHLVKILRFEVVGISEDGRSQDAGIRGDIVVHSEWSGKLE